MAGNITGHTGAVAASVTTNTIDAMVAYTVAIYGANLAVRLVAMALSITHFAIFPAGVVLKISRHK